MLARVPSASGACKCVDHDRQLLCLQETPQTHRLEKEMERNSKRYKGKVETEGYLQQHVRGYVTTLNEGGEALEEGGRLRLCGRHDDRVSEE